MVVIEDHALDVMDEELPRRVVVKAGRTAGCKAGGATSTAPNSVRSIRARPTVDSDDGLAALAEDVSSTSALRCSKLRKCESEQKIYFQVVDEKQCG